MTTDRPNRAWCDLSVVDVEGDVYVRLADVVTNLRTDVATLVDRGATAEAAALEDLATDLDLSLIAHHLTEESTP